MKIEPKTVRRRVKALTDPQPQFVSLVKGGANMTPLRTIKEEPVVVADIVQPVATSEDTPVSNPNSAPTQATKTELDILKLTFDPSFFASEAGVSAWLNEGGYDNYNIIGTTNGGFEVTSKDDDITGIEMTVVADFAPGITVHIAKPTVVDNQLVAATNKTETMVAELRAKFDVWAMGYGGWNRAEEAPSKTLDDVLEDGFDGVPPGATECMAAFGVAMANCVKDNDLAAITVLGTEFGAMMAKLAALFPVPEKETSTKTDTARIDTARAGLSDLLEGVFAAKADMTNSDVPKGTSGDAKGKAKPNFLKKKKPGDAAMTDIKKAEPRADGMPTEPTKTVNAVTLPIVDTQSGNYPSAGGATPQGQTDAAQATGTPKDGKKPATGPEQEDEAQAHGTPSGGTLPQGQTDIVQPSGAPSGAAAPEGQTDATQAHGTPTGGSLPQGQTDTMQAHGTKDDLAAVLAAVGAMANSVKDLTAVVTAMKADTATLTERVETVESGRQSKKGADIDTATATSSTPSTSAGKQASEFVADLARRGVMGIRQRGM